MRIILITCMFLGSGCNSAKFAAKRSAKETKAIDQKGAPQPDPITVREEGNLSLVKPALAVRRPSCIACHAKISGNLVSDFAHGESFGINAKNIKDLETTSVRDDAWGSIELNGSLIVPKIALTDAELVNDYKSFDNTIKDLSIATLLTKRNTVGCHDKTSSCVSVNVVGPSRDKSKAGINEIKEVGSVSIKPPDDTIMRQIFEKEPKVVRDQSGEVNYGTFSGAHLNGLAIGNGLNGPYVTNSKVLECHGNVFVQGTLVLKDLIVNDFGKGCNLYVLGSVFVKGSVSYHNQQSESNLQIASSRSIYLGFAEIYGRHLSSVGSQYYKDVVDAENNNVKSELEEAGPYMQISVSPNDEPFAASYQIVTGEINSKVYDQNNWQLLPGQIFPTFSNCVADAGTFNGSSAYDCFLKATERNRKSASYSRLLLTAQQVHGRYHGEFSGAVVADFAIFALGKFVFRYDDVFDKAVVLPLMPHKILEVK